MDKILITGGSGLLGSNIAKIAISKFDVFATYNKTKVNMKYAHFFQIDLTKKEQLNKIKRINPDFIIHCAALTDVDYCEENPNEAYKQNVLTSVDIAEIAKKIGAYLIHISTDSVFDGTKGNYKEEDIPNPINVYGKTKLEAEQKVLSIYPNSCIVRTNIYGWNVQSKLKLAEWFLENLRNKKEINGFVDVYFTPILVNNLSDAILELYERNKKGIYNIVGSERVSKYEFGVKLAEVFQLDASLITRANVDEFNFTAERPKDTSLDVRKAEKELNTKLLRVKDGLIKFRSLEENSYVSKLKRCLT